MKRIISLLLSLIVLISSFSQGLISFATDIDSNKDLYDFADDLSVLIRDYSTDDISNKDGFDGYVASVDNLLNKQEASDVNVLPLSAFETKRLIVKSHKKIDEFDAVECVSGYNDLYILQYESMLSAKMAYEKYLTLDCVEYVEPDMILSACVDNLPGDIIDEDNISGLDDVTVDAMSWLQDKIGFSDIKEKLLTMIQDDYVLVAVIDSGADTDHEQLVGRLEESNVNLSSSGERNSCEDDYGHGTHVAGIIANNTLDNVKIKPYKVLNEDGRCALSVVAIAVDMAVADGADVINLSLTGEGESQVMTEAVDKAVANNVNVVVAAGNNGKDLDKKYFSPACIESAITVSASDNNDNLASFSNYDGPIDIAAPGVNIRSCYLNNSYVTMSGTSMSAPQVSAGLAIVQTVIKDLSAFETEKKIKDFAIRVFEKEEENHFGAGILYLKYLLDEKPTTANPVFSVESCNFSSKLNLEITCPEPDASIYYLTSRLGEDEIEDWLVAERYTEPITILSDTKVLAIAITKGKMPSEIVSAEYDRVVDKEEDNYEINTLGYITAYYGDEINLLVPDTINGKKVKGIASSAFENDTRIRTVNLPETATKINSKAFKGCTALVSVSGNGITEISTSAFEGSSISAVNFPALKTIGNKAFADCLDLTFISMSKVETIGTNAFNKTPELKELNSESLIQIGKYAFKESGLQSVNLPNATTIDWSVFLGCEDLVSASIPQLTKLDISVFQNCTSLKTIDMPLLISIGADAFRNTGIEEYFGRYVETIGNYSFAECSCLAEVILPSTTSSGTNAFKDCTDLQIVMLPSMIELNSNSFYNCPKLKMLYLPSVKTVGSAAFLYSSIEFLKFNCVEDIKSLPDTLKGIVLSSTLTSITAITSETDFIVYGYENTYAHQYAIDKGKEFHTVPAIVYETEGQVNPEDDYIVVYALGFNCEYQWYKNDKVSNVGGTPISGANYYYYEPTAEDNAVVYYCVITSNDGANFNSITTNPIINIPQYRPADLTEYNKVIEEVNAIDRDSVDKELLDELDDLLKTDVSKLTYDSQYVVDYLVDDIRFVLYEVYNGVMLGDMNHDHKITAYDARIVLRCVSGTIELSPHKLKSADFNGDGEVSAYDVRLILKKAVE